MDNLPSGTVTFLFTDIESSTKLWERQPEEMKAALARHDAILKEAIESNHGTIVKTTGDGVHAVFPTAIDAITTAAVAQRDLHSSFLIHPSSLPLKVRIGLHTGEAEMRDGDYYGQALNRAARIMEVAYGGQVLLSAVTAGLIRDQLPPGTNLLHLGEHRLKNLSRTENIFQLIVPGLPGDFPPLKSFNIQLNNLPAQLTSFIGREKEKAEIKAMLHSARLVTLTGSGGTGKTRLSQEVGAQELSNFQHGVWLIELASLTDPSQIIPAMAQVFGLQELPFQPLASMVMDYLRDKNILLILDNCEHLIEACARLADEFLHQCAGLKILASSREALGIVGEVAYSIPSLADSESTQLFVDRARAMNPNFHLTDANASAIAQICQRLDGIPLAVELAAARVKLLSPEQIAARLDDRFRLLVGGSRTALPRQQTLRALIDWSYDLLSDDEKRLLQYASVFVGGWKLEALEAVAGDPEMLELLDQLVNKSLVFTEERESEMRFFMLETIRQYAREKLFEAKQSAQARDRHFDYFNGLSEQMWEIYRSTDILPMVIWAKDEVENFRAALEWGFENHVEENLRLAANFCSVSSMLGNLAEGVSIAKTAVERAKSLPLVDGEADIYRKKLIARALYAQASAGFGLGNMPSALQDLKEAIAISRVTGDKLVLGYSLGMYFIASTFVNVPDGVEAAQEGLKIFSQEVDDRNGLGLSYLNMARIASSQGNESEKQRYLGKLKELIREMPGSFQVGMFFLGMGMDETARDNYQAAKKIFEDGIQIFKGMGSEYFQLVMRSEIGHIERRTGNLNQARLMYHETIRSWQDFGNRAAIAHQLECFGFLAIAKEEPQRAIKLFGAAQALRERIHSPMTDYERVEYDQFVARVRSMLPEAEFIALWAVGRSITMEQAIELALEVNHA